MIAVTRNNPFSLSKTRIIFAFIRVIAIYALVDRPVRESCEPIKTSTST